jgi:hypothetical protein
MEEKGIPAELVKDNIVDTFHLEEEYELEESIEYYKEQQLLFREALNKHLCAQRRIGPALRFWGPGAKVEPRAKVEPGALSMKLL